MLLVEETTKATLRIGTFQNTKSVKLLPLRKIIVMSNKKGILSIQGTMLLELRIGEMAKMVY